MKYLAFCTLLYLQIRDQDQKLSKKLVMELYKDIQILQIDAIFLVTKLCLDIVIINYVKIKVSQNTLNRHNDVLNQ
jgi:hypothetical protein